MMPLVRLALVALLVAVPASASASPGDGGVPLRTLCSSPTMDYCISIWTYDYTVQIMDDCCGQSKGAMHRLNVVFETFGAGYEAGTHQVLMSSESGGWGDRMMLSAHVGGLGFWAANEASGATFQGDPAAYLASYTPSVWDLSGAQHFSLGSTNHCTINVDCHEVPEPGSLLLLVTGTLGLAAAGRRRRRSSCS